MGAAPTIAQAKLALQQAGVEVDLAIRHDADELVKSYIKPTLFGLVKSALVSTAIGGAGALIGSLIFGKTQNLKSNRRLAGRRLVCIRRNQTALASRVLTGWRAGRDCQLGGDLCGAVRGKGGQ